MDISIRNVGKRFGQVTALDDVSLDLAPGEIVAVLGANGAGKTTLLRAMSGIVAPNRGEMRYDENLFRRDRLDLRRRFCFLPDFPEVSSGMTVLEHIGMVVQLYEAQDSGIEPRILALLRDYDLLPLIDSPFSTLSRGQVYKAALVALLAVDPEVWMFDEPFASGIDPPGIAAFRRHVRAAAGRQRTIIYTTQILELAEQFSDHVCVLDKGRVIALDTMDRVRQSMSPGSPLERLLAASRSDQPSQ